MKKTLIALAITGAVTGLANAQSNVVIYGVVDTGFIKENGSDTRMGSNVDNRIGFRGSEDLGGGMKATFELERRFNLNDGTLAQEGKDWDGAANVGLKGDSWGAVRLGRVNELTTETLRTLDPFYQYGVGSMLLSTQRSARIDNTIRYDSPSWSGFKFGASYSLGENMKDVTKTAYDPGNRDQDGSQVEATAGNVKYAGADNDGYAVMLGYDNGPVTLLANWSRLADSKKSYVWNLGGAYAFGPAKVSLAYEQTMDKGWKEGEISIRSKQQTWLLGLEWLLGPGRLNASLNYGKVKDVDWSATDHDSKDVKKVAIGYTYDLSKRTSIYGVVAYTGYEDDQVAGFYRGEGLNNQGDPASYNRDSVTGVQVGVTHRF